MLIQRSRVHWLTSAMVVAGLGFLLLASSTATEETDKNESLRQAAWEGQLEKVIGLLKSGADVNAKDKRGKMALTKAIVHSHGVVARILVDRGAEIDATDQFGQTAIRLALHNGLFDIAQLLRDRGAKLTLEVSPLHWGTFRESRISLEKAMTSIPGRRIMERL